ncbi:MAG TPA: DUF6221 family protein [Acidimicrobiales bacterium]|nr:DUF6221 family protein [Acidimicrobiales bacterium]
MSDGSLTLTEFLLARIAERERGAKVDLRVARWPNSMTARNARWDLADCEAKRRIMELADDATMLDIHVDGEFRVGARDEAAEPYCGDRILRALALPYADHPDYQEEWGVATA